MKHALSHASNPDSLDGPSAVGPHHDQVNAVLPRVIENRRHRCARVYGNDCLMLLVRLWNGCLEPLAHHPLGPFQKPRKFRSVNRPSKVERVGNDVQQMKGRSKSLSKHRGVDLCRVRRLTEISWHQDLGRLRDHRVP